MNIFQYVWGASLITRLVNNVRAGAVLGALLSSSALVGCSASGEPSMPFVESENAETTEQEVVKDGDGNEIFSQNTALKP